MKEKYVGTGSLTCAFLKEREAELVLEEWGGFLDTDITGEGHARWY